MARPCSQGEPTLRSQRTWKLTGGFAGASSTPRDVRAPWRERAFAASQAESAAPRMSAKRATSGGTVRWFIGE